LKHELLQAGIYPETKKVTLLLRAQTNIRYKTVIFTADVTVGI
jgi:hypothetical protein